MTVQPHYTIPVNVRPRDTPMIEAAKEIAQREHLAMAVVFRQALQEFIERRKLGEGSIKLEQYFDRDGVPNSVSVEKILVPDALKLWSDAELLSLARNLRARIQEIDGALRL